MPNAHSQSLLQDRIENRHQITGGGVDDLQHLGGRGLLRQGLLEIARALTKIAQQSCVLHRDDRLGGETL
jgi:hypothetical protein